MSPKGLRMFLTGRTQFVELEGHKSESVDILCWVPQGSILGPLLYLIYINDICNSCGTDNVLSFADDTTVHVSDTNLNQLYQYANIKINQLVEWFCANKLSLNAGNTKYIVIRPKHIRSELDGHNIFIQDTKLIRIGHDSQEKAATCLGMYVEENLTWKHHLSHINKKHI